MRDEKLYTVAWVQPYHNWYSLQQPEPEPEIVDLTEARAVLARIMSK